MLARNYFLVPLVTIWLHMLIIYLFIFISPPFNVTITIKITKILGENGGRPKRNHKAFVKWAFSTKLHTTQNTYRVISIDRPRQSNNTNLLVFWLVFVLFVTFSYWLFWLRSDLLKLHSLAFQFLEPVHLFLWISSVSIKRYLNVTDLPQIQSIAQNQF